PLQARFQPPPLAGEVAARARARPLQALGRTLPQPLEAPAQPAAGLVTALGREHEGDPGADQRAEDHAGGEPAEASSRVLGPALRLVRRGLVVGHAPSGSQRSLRTPATYRRPAR